MKQSALQQEPSEANLCPASIIYQVWSLCLYTEIRSFSTTTWNWINRDHPMHSTLIRNDDMGVEANPKMNLVWTRSTFFDRSKFLRKTHKINLMHIISEPPLLTAPWSLTNVLVCNEMTNYKKNGYPTEQLRILFNSHLHIYVCWFPYTIYWWIEDWRRSWLRCCWTACCNL